MGFQVRKFSLRVRKTQSQRKGEMIHTLHTERSNHKQDLNESLNRTSDVVARLIGGLAFGGGAGSVVGGGIGLLIGAIIGAILGAAVPSLLSDPGKRIPGSYYDK